MMVRCATKTRIRELLAGSSMRPMQTTAISWKGEGEEETELLLSWGHSKRCVLCLLYQRDRMRSVVTRNQLIKL